MNKSVSTKLGAVFASAMLLGGCATTAGNGSPQDPINRLANSVTEAGARVWDGTRYLFKLKDHDATTAENSEDEFLDEVDMALIDVKEFEKFDTSDADAAQPVAIEEQAAIEPDSTRLLPTEEIVLDDVAADANAVEAPVEVPLEAAEPVLDASAEDLFHTVSENESLWVLAKMLTGNANNWRTLAEVNNLGENGSVYVGQKLRIPAALKKVPLDGEENQTVAAEQAPTAAPEQPSVAAAQPANVDSETFTVTAGESLWTLSQRATGKPDNWLKIANFNGMDERAANHIRFGQKLQIPSELLIEGASGETVASGNEQEGAGKEAANAVAQAIAPAKQSQGIDAGTTDGTRELAAADQTDEKKVVEVPANFQAEPPADLPSEAKQAGDTHLLADEAAPLTTLQEGEIMVSGTYYPKAIYNEANFSSSLLMRVSPGTRLQVSQTIGPWYEVVTDKGTGFVHSRDTN